VGLPAGDLVLCAWGAAEIARQWKERRTVAAWLVLTRGLRIGYRRPSSAFFDKITTCRSLSLARGVGSGATRMRRIRAPDP
jgi:hypothetical protein